MAKKTVAKKKKKLSPPKKLSSKKPRKKTTKKVALKRKRKVLAIPKGFTSITPFLIVANAAKAIAFYKAAFAAKEIVRMENDSGKITYAEIKIGDAIVMLADETSERDGRSPHTMGGSPVLFHFYTKNVDGVVDKAVSAGAKLIRPIEDMFYG